MLQHLFILALIIPKPVQIIDQFNRWAHRLDASVFTGILWIDAKVHDMRRAARHRRLHVLNSRGERGLERLDRRVIKLHCEATRAIDERRGRARRGREQPKTGCAAKRATEQHCATHKAFGTLSASLQELLRPALGRRCDTGPVFNVNVNILAADTWTRERTRLLYVNVGTLWVVFVLYSSLYFTIL